MGKPKKQSDKITVEQASDEVMPDVQIEQTIQDEAYVYADLGNIDVKCVSDEGTITYQSVMGKMSKRQGFGDKAAKVVAFQFEGDALVFGAEAYYVSETPPRTYNHQDRYTDPYYRQLFASALWAQFNHLAGRGVLYPYVGLNIPALDYQLKKDVKVKQVISGRYELTPIGGGEALIVMVLPERLQVLPEGAGTYYRQLFAQGGEFVASQVIGVVDWGWLTCNKMIIDRGKPILATMDTRYSDAGKDICEQIAFELRKTHGYEGEAYRIAEVLDAGCIQIGANCVSFMDIRDQIMVDALTTAYQWFNAGRKGTTPAKVLMSGGTGAALHRLVDTAHRNLGWSLVDNAKTANADGGFQALKRKFKQG